MGDLLERWVGPSSLAKRLDTTPRNLPRYVAEGKIPQPSYHLGPKTPRWDIHAVDALMLKRAGISTSKDMDATVAKICEENRQYGRRKGRSQATG
ncbi:helix-turn-helix transcriptional regulator [Komagataeibacter europaeus]|uniref:helix-turn-helix transcriptional regulator n=1 Tax=Komagataeibacter europaeus TaxID=33995 RepID=UPI0009DAAEAC|nr:hypothetical protein [Komagataeibacter europaeus]GBQ44970.1 hypothetical protein AA18890_2329 [Komagataeibacter europaeus LMG 18890]